MPLLYSELAGWFHLLTAPADYAEEAEVYRQAIMANCDGPARTLLELGSGGGNNASHYKQWFEATLVDRSPQMLAMSRGINPECEHVEGDMRSVRLRRQFDAVFVHDAVAYLVSEEELRACMATAFAHCRPGGVALFVPDYVRDTFKGGVNTGGHDGDDGRALRYVEWVWDPDPSDCTYITDMAYLLREGTETRAVHDRHVEGVFPRADWVRWLGQAGFDPVTVTPLVLPDDDEFYHSEVFVGRRAR